MKVVFTNDNRYYLYYKCWHVDTINRKSFNWLATYLRYGLVQYYHTPIKLK